MAVKSRALRQVLRGEVERRFPPRIKRRIGGKIVEIGKFTGRKGKSVFGFKVRGSF